jgi:hypothetical protein
MARPEVTGKRINDDESFLVSGAHRARAPPKTRLLQPLAYSVEEFCQAHGISVGHFYNLQKAKLGPKTMKVGTRTLISAEEAERWRAERTDATSDNAA